MSFGPSHPDRPHYQGPAQKAESGRKSSFRASAISKSKLTKNSLDFRISIRDDGDDSVEITKIDEPGGSLTGQAHYL